MEHNYLKEFERGPPKEHSCEIWLKSSQQFLRRSFLKKKFTDARTDERTDARRPHAMTIARWPSASGAKKQEGHDGPVPLHWLIREIPSYQTLQYLGIGLKHKTL